jgi:hypothetical protein
MPIMMMPPSRLVVEVSGDLQPKKQTISCRKCSQNIINLRAQLPNPSSSKQPRRCCQQRSWAPDKLAPVLQGWRKYQKIPNSLENGQKDNRQHCDVA